MIHSPVILITDLVRVPEDDPAVREDQRARAVGRPVD